MKLKILDLIQSFWAANNLKGFKLACQFLNVHIIFNVHPKDDHQVPQQPSLSDSALPHTVNKECIDTNKDEVLAPNTGLEKEKDANPDSLWGNPFDSLINNVVVPVNHPKGGASPAIHLDINPDGSQPRGDPGPDEHLWHFFDADDGYSQSTESHALVSALSSSQCDNLGENCMATFDCDSVFWVCDNSATGHICNNKRFFKGTLVPADVSVSSATGVSNQLTMGIVLLTLQDDDGLQHTFNLHKVIYMPHSPVNILSTKRLAELFPTISGAPDKKGTGVTSLYDDYLLFWDNRRFTK